MNSLKRIERSKRFSGTI